MPSPARTPARTEYKHLICNTNSRLLSDVAEMFRKDPHYFQFIYCWNCRKFVPAATCVWTDDETKVGS